MDAERMYKRQLQRADLAEHWLDLLDLKEGAVLLDVGAGPGLHSLLAARRVGETGLVYAIDIAPEALAYLGTLQAAQGITNIERIQADAKELQALPRRADAALVTFMLHHDPGAAGLLANVARWLRPGARALIAEFDPAGPCEKGPERERRLAQPLVKAWCEAAGLHVVHEEQQTPEHYLLVVQSK